MNLSFEEICSATHARVKGTTATGHCPMPDHPDLNPSLSIWQKEGKTFVKCMSRKCDHGKILTEIGKKLELASHASDSTNMEAPAREKVSSFVNAQPLSGSDYIARKGLSLEKGPVAAFNLDDVNHRITFNLERMGKQTGTHVILLDQFNDKDSAIKRTFGTLTGSSIVFWGSNDCYICEGPVTGLSLFEVTGGTVFVSCGHENLVNTSLPNVKFDSIRVVPDMDEEGLTSSSKLCEILHATRKEPVFLCPLSKAAKASKASKWSKREELEKIKGYDANDVHRILGANALLELLGSKVEWGKARKDFWQAPEVYESVTADPIPMSALPKTMRDFVAERSQLLQAPPDYLIMSLFAAMGSLACGRFELSMRSENETFIVHPNIYAMLVGHPSAKKSPSMNTALNFLRPLAKAQDALKIALHSSRSADLKVVENSIEKHLKEASKTSDPAQAREVESKINRLESERAQLNSLAIKFDPIFTTDATPEAIVRLASGASRGILSYFDEAAKFLQQAAREGFAENRSLLNIGFSGCEPYRCDRVTVNRPPVEALRLGFLGAIQPEVLKPLLKSTVDGFLARFFFIYPLPIKATLIDESTDDALTRKITKIFEDVYNTNSVKRFKFSEAAWKSYSGVFSQFQALTSEASARSILLEGFFGKFESHLGALCIVLQLFEDHTKDRIEIHTLNSAVRVFEALVSHYEKTVSEADSESQIVEAIKQGTLRNGSTLRDLKRTRYFSRNEVELTALLKKLEEKHIVKCITAGTGGRPSQMIFTNPHLSAEGSVAISVMLQPSEDSTEADPFAPFDTFDVAPKYQNHDGSASTCGFAIVEWQPALGCIGAKLAIDTETTSIKDHQTPDLKLIQACTEEDCVYLISPFHCAAFLEAHQKCEFVFHNFTFDLAVLEKFSGFDFLPFLASQTPRMFDIGLLYRLYKLAIEGEVPHKWSLSEVSQQVLNVEMDKSDEVRLSWDSLPTDQNEIMPFLSEEQKKYAASDVRNTLLIFKKLEAQILERQFSNCLSLGVQTQGAWALHQISKRGMKVDQKLLSFRQELVLRELQKAKETLASHGYTAKAKGNRTIIEKEVERVCSERKINLKRSEKSSKVKIDESALASLLPYSQLLTSYAEVVKLKKLHDFFSQFSGGYIFPRYNTLLRTGRTSSRSPNIQNLPRTGVREILIPSEGHCFIIADYAGLELVTLAQHCLTRFGSSKMAQLINDGKDLHSELAMQIMRKDFDAMPKEPKVPKVPKGSVNISQKQIPKEARQRAKALNFGIPGGLGAQKLAEYAKNSFGVEMSLEEAKKLKSEFLRFYPEIKLHLQKVVDGNETVSTLSGRVAANSTYCQARNFPFQGLAADGAKRALFNLECAGFRTVAFIHDEVIVEVPYSGPGDLSLNRKGKEIEQIMVAAMKEFTPDVVVRVEWFASDRWAKQGQLTFDEKGNVIPFTGEVAQ